MCAKCLQIDLLPGATEHLLGTEGLDAPCSERLPANGSVSPAHNRVVLADEGSGDRRQVLGTGRAVETDRARVATRRCRRRRERRRTEHGAEEIPGAIGIGHGAVPRENFALSVTLCH